MKFSIILTRLKMKKVGKVPFCFYLQFRTQVFRKMYLHCILHFHTRSLQIFHDSYISGVFCVHIQCFRNKEIAMAFSKKNILHSPLKFFFLGGGGHYCNLPFFYDLFLKRSKILYLTNLTYLPNMFLPNFVKN